MPFSEMWLRTLDSAIWDTPQNPSYQLNKDRVVDALPNLFCCYFCFTPLKEVHSFSNIHGLPFSKTNYYSSLCQLRRSTEKESINLVDSLCSCVKDSLWDKDVLLVFL